MISSKPKDNAVIRFKENGKGIESRLNEIKITVFLCIIDKVKQNVPKTHEEDLRGSCKKTPVITLMK